MNGTTVLNIDSSAERREYGVTRFEDCEFEDTKIMKNV